MRRPCRWTPFAATARWFSAFGSFTRRVRLSDNLDAEAIEASHHDGVLEIRIPVREEAKPRKITVAAPSEAKELAS
jgi:HSP20 family protein